MIIKLFLFFALLFFNDKKTLQEKYKDIKPLSFSEHGNGIIDSVDTQENFIFLTFDACGGMKGSGYDTSLINLLIEENIYSTLFISGRWITKNIKLFQELQKKDIFDIQNHGFNHKPLSVSKRTIYGIETTNSIDGIYDEVIMNENLFTEYLNYKPKFFRSGTAFYDDVSIKIVNDLGYKIIGFSVNGDGGAKFSKQEIIKSCENIKKGDIIIFHFNRPNGFTYEALKEIIPKLKNKGFKFAKLSSYI